MRPTGAASRCSRPADNVCIFDCRYCINRKSSNVQRARFTVAEVEQLTLDFYRRNCIEGLFLSSGIIRSQRLHHGATGGSGAPPLRGA